MTSGNNFYVPFNAVRLKENRREGGRERLSSKQGREWETRIQVARLLNPEKKSTQHRHTRARADTGSLARQGNLERFSYEYFNINLYRAEKAIPWRQLKADKDYLRKKGVLYASQGHGCSCDRFQGST